MGLIKLLNSLKKQVKRKKYDVVADESFLRSEVVYHAQNNFIILISLTKEYFFQLAEFVDACALAGLNTKVLNSSYETEDEEKDGDFGKLIVLHERYYCLVGGEYKYFASLYLHINLSNDILQHITDDIYAYCDSSYFKRLIDDSVLQEHKFNYKNIRPQYANTPDAYRGVNGNTVCIDNIEYIMSRLPRGFNAYSMVRFINVFTHDNRYYQYSLRYYLSKLDWKAIEESGGHLAIEPQLKHLIKNISKESIERLFDPLYMVEDEDGDALPGDLSDESLDDIFRERYERFTGIADEYVGYEDIDEKLSEEEGENPDESDVMGDDV